MKSSSDNVQEIELFDILKTIWNGKWIVISIAIIFSLLPLYSFYNQNIYYKISSTFYPVSSNLYYLEHFNLNRILGKFDKNLQINKRNFYDLFISHFRNKELLKKSLEDSKYFNELTKDMNKIEKKAFIENIASAFELKKINDVLWDIKFQWKSKEEATLIFEDVINEIHKSTIKTTNKTILKLLKTIELMSIDKNQVDENLLIKRINFLKKHIILAKEAGIKVNKFENHTLGNIRENYYYLRGYQIIEKELKLMLQNKLEKNISPIRQIETKILISRISNELFDNDTVNKWVSYDNPKVLMIKKNYNKIILFAFAGIVVGIITVLLANAFFAYKNRI